MDRIRQVLKICMQKKGVLDLADCLKPATHRVPGYFHQGRDRALYYCADHARRWDRLHPFGTPAEAIPARRKAVRR